MRPWCESMLDFRLLVSAVGEALRLPDETTVVPKHEQPNSH